MLYQTINSQVNISWRSKPELFDRLTGLNYKNMIIIIHEPIEVEIYNSNLENLTSV